MMTTFISSEKLDALLEETSRIRRLDADLAILAIKGIPKPDWDVIVLALTYRSQTGERPSAFDTAHSKWGMAVVDHIAQRRFWYSSRGIHTMAGILESTLDPETLELLFLKLRTYDGPGTIHKSL